MSRMLLILMAAACATVTPAAAEGIEQRFTFEGGELVVANLVGKVRVEPAEGSSFEVNVSVRGRDAAPGKITFDKTDGARARLAVRFPAEKEARYVYPEMGSDFKTTIDVSGDAEGARGRFIDLVLPGNHERVRLSNEGDGLQIWADVTVRMPRGKKLVVQHGAGSIETEGIVGGLVLDSHCGPVTVVRSNGKVSIDTGGGNVLVSDSSGELAIDTGGGNVRVSDASGELAIDTGSGSVDLFRCRAAHVNVDTGSGSVSAAEIECDAMRIDTGSGDVSVLLTRMGVGDFLIDAGSGSVDLRVPADVSARFVADTGSGGSTSIFRACRSNAIRPTNWRSRWATVMGP